MITWCDLDLDTLPWQVHRGTREEDIVNVITKAERETKKNKANKVDTVVFFDEANTTDAINLIKEIMCDRWLNGKPVSEDLKFIAACNPYRRCDCSVLWFSF